MSLSLYDASITVYLQMLKNLSHFLDKAETYAAEEHVQLSTFTEASLGHGMANFVRQIQLASDAAKSGAARLAGVEAPSMPDTETTFPELKERIAKTIAFVESIKREQVHGQEGRAVVLTFPGRTMEFTRPELPPDLQPPQLHLPRHDGLRDPPQPGVPLGKMDFLAGAQTPA